MGVNHYDKQFKEQEVKLSRQHEIVSEVARELGISGSQLTKWYKDFPVYGEHSFSVRWNERLTEVERENKELEHLPSTNRRKKAIIL